MTLYFLGLVSGGITSFLLLEWGVHPYIVLGIVSAPLLITIITGNFFKD